MEEKKDPLEEFKKFLEGMENSMKEREARQLESKKKWAEENPKQATCNHGVTFDKDAADKLIAEASSTQSEKILSDEDAAIDFIMGPSYSSEIRARWPRLFGKCPLGCGYNGIYYASTEHYIYGDW